MKIAVDLPLRDKHVALFTPEHLEALAEALPGKPVMINPSGTDPQDRIGTVESAQVAGDRVRAVLDVDVPEGLRDDPALRYGINANVKKKITDGEVSLAEFTRLNSVDLVRAGDLT